MFACYGWSRAPGMVRSARNSTIRILNSSPGGLWGEKMTQAITVLSRRDGKKEKAMPVPVQVLRGVGASTIP